MNVETFFNHWGLDENPFMAEEAKDDSVYIRIMDSEMNHPDFEKIYGSPTHPSTAVVFGEKGSGKTAIRMLLEKRLVDHNASNPERKVWLVKKDDLNPFIDSVLHSIGATEATPENLQRIRLEDHMDSILSESVTDLVDFMLKEDDLGIEKVRRNRKRLRRMSRQKRLDLAEMIMLYDKPTKSNAISRWNKIKAILKVRKFWNLSATFWTSIIALFAAGGLGAYAFLAGAMDPYTLGGFGVATLAFLFLFFNWIKESARTGKLAKQIASEIRVVHHASNNLKKKLSDFNSRDLEAQPMPVPGDQDSRYELTSRLIRILDEIGYANVVVLYDRIDEPASINGEPKKMRAVIWPVFNNKFLQQNNIGFKLLLPQELGYMLKREDSEFFLKARLDKQNLVEKLEWTGPTLYDICSKRLQGCQGDDGKVKKLADIFAEDVGAQELIDALDQMLQPRDAFKFLYAVIQEHCQNSTDEAPDWRIPKLVLDQVRKQQSQRVQDLARGLSPA